MRYTLSLLLVLLLPGCWSVTRIDPAVTVASRRETSDGPADGGETWDVCVFPATSQPAFEPPLRPVPHEEGRR